MRMRKVATGRIFRCKSCGENPVIITSVEMFARWGGNGVPVESHMATVTCLHGGNTGKHTGAIPPWKTTSPTLAGIKKNTAISVAIESWNRYYGKP